MELQFGVLTVSDRSFAGTRSDISGPALVNELIKSGWIVIRTGIVPDEFDAIKNALLDWCSQDVVEIILTTGGTGFAPRDITPEATISIVDRITPGLCEAMRSASLAITPYAMLSRAFAGIKGRTLIVNLPGSPKAALENLNVLKPVFEHAVELLREKPEAEQGHNPQSGMKGKL